MNETSRKCLFIGLKCGLYCNSVCAYLSTIPPAGAACVLPNQEQLQASILTAARKPCRLPLMNTSRIKPSVTSPIHE